LVHVSIQVAEKSSKFWELSCVQTIVDDSVYCVFSLAMRDWPTRAL
jgi:hypothetical protein